MTFDIGLHELCVRVGVRYVITKFSRMDSLPNFLTHGAPLRARFARAGAPLIGRNKLGQKGVETLIHALSGSAVMRSRTGTSWPFRSRSAVRARKMAPSSWR